MGFTWTSHLLHQPESFLQYPALLDSKPCSNLAQKVLTTEHRVVGGAALWRYITRNAICAGLDQLNVALRDKDKWVEDTQKTTHSRPFSSAIAVQRDKIPGHFISKSNRQENEGAVNKGSGSVNLEERHKELIRMKIKRLHGAKTIIEREHFLNGGESANGGVGNSRYIC